jgi:hypothetical protein
MPLDRERLLGCRSVSDADGPRRGSAGLRDFTESPAVGVADLEPLALGERTLGGGVGVRPSSAESWYASSVFDDRLERVEVPPVSLYSSCFLRSPSSKWVMILRTLGK